MLSRKEGFTKIEQIIQNIALAISEGSSLAISLPSERLKAPPSRKRDDKGGKKLRLQAVLQHLYQQLQQQDPQQQDRATLAALLQTVVAKQQQLAALQQNLIQLKVAQDIQLSRINYTLDQSCLIISS